MLIRIIGNAFAPAPNCRDGVAHYCGKLARLFQLADAANSCPISALLFDGPENAEFRARPRPSSSA